MPSIPPANPPHRNVSGTGADQRRGSPHVPEELLQNLIEALREELRQFGEILMLLEQQRELLRSREVRDFFPSVAAINTQAETLRAARHEREQRRRDLAYRLGLVEDSRLAQLLPHLPPDYRPLLEALIRENHELHARSQQDVRDNQDALDRAIELMPDLFDPAFAQDQTH